MPLNFPEMEISSPKFCNEKISQQTKNSGGRGGAATVPLLATIELRSLGAGCAVQEESAVAEKYARLIASRQLSMEDVNEVLNQHTRSVHLLRIRQSDERRRLLDLLDAKRHTRRTTDDDDDDDTGPASTSAQVCTEVH